MFLLTPEAFQSSIILGVLGKHCNGFHHNCVYFASCFGACIFKYVDSFVMFPLCLGVLKHSVPGFFTMDFCLCCVILNLKAFCFGAIPDIMIELIVYGSVS